MKQSDILTRHSRPQRHSTWTPKTRDWRYASGVFQHEDFDDTPNERSAWDTLDYDYQIQRGGRRRSISGMETGTGGSSDIEGGGGGITPTPVLKNVKREERKNTASTITQFMSNGEGKEMLYRPISLLVKLRFKSKRKFFVENTSPTPLVGSTSPGEHGSYHYPDTSSTSNTVDSIGLPAYHRPWIDETQDFNIRDVRGIIRLPDAKVEGLGREYGWYDDAVAVDALLPPGIPMSAKEILAYYPHHVRWVGIMDRLAGNGYRGEDIVGMQRFFRGDPTHHMSVSQMSKFQREAVKSKTAHITSTLRKGKVKGRHTLSTTHLTPGTHIQTKRNGYTVPTFTDLLSGLHNLPTGLHARTLTQCLRWYLDVRDTFTPRLEMNVLHTQALSRALRVPVKGFGGRNLDRVAVEEWRDRARFDEKEVRFGKMGVVSREEVGGRSRMCLDCGEGDVRLHIRIPVRHVLVFPFVALYGVVGEALKLGIEKAGERRRERVRGDVLSGEGRSGLGTPVGDGEGTVEEKKKKTEPYRIPKRARSSQDLPTAKRRTVSPAGGGRIPTGPRAESFRRPCQLQGTLRPAPPYAYDRRGYEARSLSDENGRGRSGYGEYGCGYRR